MAVMSTYADRPVVAQGTGDKVVRLPRVRGPISLTLVCLQRHMISLRLVRHGETLAQFSGACDDGVAASQQLGTHGWPDTLIVTPALRDTDWTIFGAMTDRVS